ncbi:MAG: molybdopterin oxidoreductase, partial [Firmicutes bacterium]|nr:molybdopterin oxidoreductase [Bacillota bacterium]
MSKSEKELSRRELLTNAAFLGGSAVLASQLPLAASLMRKAEAGQLGSGEDYALAHAESVVYSVCLQCHNACPIKGKVLGGTLVKIDGNAYSPQNALPHLDYASDLQAAARVDAKLCPKGQAGIQTLYDPYRLRKVLKRSGPRGSGKWRTIPFDQAIGEIVEGGVLFADVPGEENRKAPGLKDLWRVRDGATIKSLAEDSAKVAKGEMTPDAFKATHSSHLDALIDPEHPDLGPVNNQFVFLAGRIEEGRKEYAKRWLN